MSALPLTSVRGGNPSGLRDRVPPNFWASLRYFNSYRLVIAVLFLLSATLGEEWRLGSDRPGLFLAVSAAYFVSAIAFHVLLLRHKSHFDLQLIAQVVCDVLAVVLLTHASGGFRSGLEMMLLVSLAGAALVGYGRMILAFAALASIAVLLEHTVRVFVRGADNGASFLQPGLISIGYFATAIIANQLARRVLVHETLARERGVALANQVKVNELVIRDLQDGVLVVDAGGLIAQHNPQAAVLMGAKDMPGNYVGRYSTELAQGLRKWREARDESGLSFSLDRRKLRARFMETEGVTGHLTVVYLEDESRIEEREQQVKLAALGRLTANVAHEIRNPLSSIVHAADLMEEENRAPARARLTRIIRDNAARLDHMVRDILELNRRDRAQRENLHLGSFLAHCMGEIGESESIPPDGIRLSVDTDATVQFDRVHLNQIMWNLLRNAWRHSRKQDGSVELKLSRVADRLELHVIDDGEGVPAHLQAQLFEPFFTTYSVGTGLGLYIARELCSANGATLEYVPGERGADFCIRWSDSGRENEPH